MSRKENPLEERVAELERQVAALKAAAPFTQSISVMPGFAEGGQAALAESAPPGDEPEQSLEQRVLRLEDEVAELRGKSQKQAMLDRLGIFKDDKGYDEAVRLGREWRRRAK